MVSTVTFSDGDRSPGRGRDLSKVTQFNSSTAGMRTQVSCLRAGVLSGPKCSKTVQGHKLFKLGTCPPEEWKGY